MNRTSWKEGDLRVTLAGVDRDRHNMQWAFRGVP